MKKMMKVGMVLESLNVCDECKKKSVRYTARHVIINKDVELCVKCIDLLIKMGSVKNVKEVKA